MKFYEQYYGQRQHAAVVDVARKLLHRYSTHKGDVTLLDIGSGDMSMTRTFVDAVNQDASSSKISEVIGWDISRTGVERARDNGLACFQKDITGTLDPAYEGTADIVVFFEVLEHIVDTDTAVQNINRILRPDGLLLLSTPNLAAWYNRIFLMFGVQPHCTEVSSVPIRFGSRFVHKLLGEEEGQASSVAGHLRVFTWRALREFLDYHGFEILAAKGCPNHKWDLVTRVLGSISTGLAGDICVLARKKGAA